MYTGFPLLIKQLVPWFSNKEWLRPFSHYDLWHHNLQERTMGCMNDMHEEATNKHKKLCYQHTVVEIRTEIRGWNARQTNQRLDDDYSLWIKKYIQSRIIHRVKNKVNKDKISRHKTKLDVWKPMQWKR